MREAYLKPVSAAVSDIPLFRDIVSLNKYQSIYILWDNAPFGLCPSLHKPHNNKIGLLSSNPQKNKTQPTPVKIRSSTYSRNSSCYYNAIYLNK